MNSLQAADVRPTTMQLNAIASARVAAAPALAKWQALVTTDLPALNAKLAAAGLTALKP